MLSVTSIALPSGTAAPIPPRLPSVSFRPGTSGNPLGVSAVHAEIRRLARENCPRAFGRIVELVEDPDPSVAFVAAKEVLDRGLGKVKEADPNEDSIANLPSEQRRKAIMERLAYAATLMPPKPVEE